MGREILRILIESGPNIGSGAFRFYAIVALMIVNVEDRNGADGNEGLKKWVRRTIKWRDRGGKVDIRSEWVESEFIAAAWKRVVGHVEGAEIDYGGKC